MAKKQELANVASEQDLAVLNESFPVETSINRITLPRLGMFAKDKYEGQGKTAKLIEEAGVYFTEAPGEEENDKGKKIWVKNEIGNTFQGIILFQRKKLVHCDATVEPNVYTSSPVYDSDDETLPLWRKGTEVYRGLPKELQAISEFQGETSKKKPITKLEENRILYILYKDTVYEACIKGTSKWSYSDYRKKVLGGIAPSAVVTKFNSKSETKGSNTWSLMTFEKVRLLSQDEVADVTSRVKEIISTIKAEKAQYATDSVASKKADEDFS